MLFLCLYNLKSPCNAFPPVLRTLRAHIFLVMFVNVFIGGKNPFFSWFNFQGSGCWISSNFAPILILLLLPFLLCHFKRSWFTVSRKYLFCIVLIPTHTHPHWNRPGRRGRRYHNSVGVVNPVPVLIYERRKELILLLS